MIEELSFMMREVEVVVSDIRDGLSGQKDVLQLWSYRDSSRGGLLFLY